MRRNQANTSPLQEYTRTFLKDIEGGQTIEWRIMSRQEALIHLMAHIRGIKLLEGKDLSNYTGSIKKRTPINVIKGRTNAHSVQKTTRPFTAKEQGAHITTTREEIIRKLLKTYKSRNRHVDVEIFEKYLKAKHVEMLKRTHLASSEYYRSAKNPTHTKKTALTKGYELGKLPTKPLREDLILEALNEYTKAFMNNYTQKKTTPVEPKSSNNHGGIKSPISGPDSLNNRELMGGNAYVLTFNNVKLTQPNGKVPEAVRQEADRFNGLQSRIREELTEVANE